MPHHIIVYGKPGCHLCEIATQLLEGLHREFDFTLEKVDITNDPALFALYRERIPVALIDGRITLSAPIRMVHVRAALTGRLGC